MRDVMYIGSCKNREFEDITTKNNSNTKMYNSHENRLNHSSTYFWVTFFSFLSLSNKNDNRYWTAVYYKRLLFLFYLNTLNKKNRKTLCSRIINGASKSSEFCRLIRFPNCILCFSHRKCIQTPAAIHISLSHFRDNQVQTEKKCCRRS